MFGGWNQSMFCKIPYINKRCIAAWVPVVIPWSLFDLGCHFKSYQPRSHHTICQASWNKLIETSWTTSQSAKWNQCSNLHVWHVLWENSHLRNSHFLVWEVTCIYSYPTQRKHSSTEMIRKWSKNVQVWHEQVEWPKAWPFLTPPPGRITI